MISAFGIEHGDEISKGLPSAVRQGGGGHYGRLLRGKKAMGRDAGRVPEGTRKIVIDAGKSYKALARDQRQAARVEQSYRGKAARRHRAQLLNEDSASRRKGFKTGKSSALDRGYRGRVSNKMTALP